MQTIADIVERVKRQFGDTANAQINSAGIIDWINDGVIELVVSNDLLQVEAGTGTTAGFASYPVPVDLMTFDSILCNGLPLRGISKQEADKNWDRAATTAQGTPVEFYIYAGKFNLYPTPDTNYTLKLRYTQQPTLVDDEADTIPIPAQYHNRLVEYCLAQAAELDGRNDVAQQKLSQFAGGAAALRDNQSWDERDFYPSITASERDYGYGGW